MVDACLCRNGQPKRAFESEAAAREAAVELGDGAKVYSCVSHGWHIGGVLTRALRSALYHSQRKRKKK